jgi:hypothetical protein
MGIVERRHHTLAAARRNATLARLRRCARNGTLSLFYSVADIDERKEPFATDVLRRGGWATRCSARS